MAPRGSQGFPQRDPCQRSRPLISRRAPREDPASIQFLPARGVAREGSEASERGGIFLPLRGGIQSFQTLSAIGAFNTKHKRASRRSLENSAPHTPTPFDSKMPSALHLPANPRGRRKAVARSLLRSFGNSMARQKSAATKSFRAWMRQAIGQFGLNVY